MPLYALIIIIVSIPCIMGIHLFLHRRYHYICPKCSQEFKPTFFRSLIAINALTHRVIRCTVCNSYGCKRILKD